MEFSQQSNMFLALTLFFCAGIHYAKCWDGKISKCTFPEKKTIHVKCPAGTVIRINEAIYGVNKHNLCLYTKGDCVANVNLTSECCGRTQCNVTYWRVYDVRCNGGSFVTFFRLIYHCIPPEQSECAVSLPVISQTTRSQRTTTTKYSPTTTQTELPGPEEVALEEDTSENFPIIIGSAVIVALLLASIITIIFLLRKFQWNSEKQCFLQMFVGLCKRHPPDGCENPDEGSSGSRDSVTIVVNERDSSDSNSRSKSETLETQHCDTLTRSVPNKNDFKNENAENSSPMLISQKRKRKRDEPLPDITKSLVEQEENINENSPKLSGKHYKRNIKIAHGKKSEALIKGQSKRVPMDITNIADKSVNTIVSEGPGITAV